MPNRNLYSCHSCQQMLYMAHEMFCSNNEMRHSSDEMPCRSNDMGYRSNEMAHRNNEMQDITLEILRRSYDFAPSSKHRLSRGYSFNDKISECSTGNNTGRVCVGKKANTRCHLFS